MLDLYFIHTSSILQLYLKEGEKQEERRKKKEERRKKKEEREKFLQLFFYVIVCLCVVLPEWDNNQGVGMEFFGGYVVFCIFVVPQPRFYFGRGDGCNLIKL